jgi:4-phytase / acid phosphatase
MKPWCAALAALVVLAAAESSAAQAKLERVVIVQRHGVRPPTKAAADLAKYSEKAWPEWSVPPGELTAHGAEAMTVMGSAIVRSYVRSGLFADGACPAGTFVWSDSADQRTRASGDAIQKGFGCASPSQHLAAGETDPLFDPIEAGICPIDPARAKDATETWLRLSLAHHRDAYEKGRKVLQSVLTPNGCGKPGQRACLVGDGDNTVTATGSVEGPLRAASTLSENLLLEYSEGLPLKDVGWGKGAEVLADILPLHNLYADVARRNVYFASRRGSLLAQQVVDLLNRRPSTFKGAAPVPADAKLVVFLGHDTNLSNMSGFMATPWSLPGQPDATAPGTALAFELWRDDKGVPSIKVNAFYQTPEDARTLAAPRQMTIAMAGCRDGACALPDLTWLLEMNLAHDCLTR